VPDFDGTDRLELSGLPTGTDPSATFVVARLDDPAPAGSGVQVVAGWGPVSAAGTRTLTKSNASSDAALESDSLGPFSIGAWSAGGWREFDDAWTPAAGGTVSGWSAGGGEPAARATGYAFATGNGDGAVGDGPGGGAGWQGPVAELVVLTGTVSADDRRTVQEYLARKWGQRIAPAAPATAAATASGPTSVTVSWAAPGWDGGGAVSGYTATAVPGGGTCSTAGTGCTITGLSAGQGYTVTVTATNSAGTGPGSDAAAVAL
jgi:hypothetical protein